MAYIIVLRFEDDEKPSAQDLAAEYEEWLIGVYYAQDEETPTCKCWGDLSEREIYKKENQPLLRIKSTGWYVCPTCKKPRKNAFQNPRNLRPEKDPTKRISFNYGSNMGTMPDGYYKKR